MRSLWQVAAYASRFTRPHNDMPPRYAVYTYKSTYCQMSLHHWSVALFPGHPLAFNNRANQNMSPLAPRLLYICGGATTQCLAHTRDARRTKLPRLYTRRQMCAAISCACCATQMSCAPMSCAWYYVMFTWDEPIFRAAGEYMHWHLVCRMCHHQQWTTSLYSAHMPSWESVMRVWYNKVVTGRHSGLSPKHTMIIWLCVSGALLLVNINAAIDAPWMWLRGWKWNAFFRYTSYSIV